MTINSISDLNAWVAQLGASAGSSRSNTADGTNTGSVTSGSPPPPPPGGGLVNAIMDALSQIGVSDSGSTADGSTSSVDSSSSSAAGSSTSQASGTDPDSQTLQALQSFMQSLFAALHAQSGGGLNQSAESNTAGTSAVGSVTAGGGRPDPASDLQSLIQKLTSSDSQSTSSQTDSSVTDLEQSFQNLVSAAGGTDSSSETLKNFLSALASRMADTSAVGNIISTRA